MPARTFVVRPPGEPERVGRTLRALAAAGVDAEDAGADLAGAIAAGYGFEGPAVELGAAQREGTTYPAARVRVPLAMLNRHGLVAGATGTGKTKSLQVMAEQLSADHVLLLRLHPFVRKATPIPDDLRAFAIDVSDHPDIHELMLVSDVLITDYSSAIFEFSLLTRPMVFFAPDHDDYLDERGFYWDYQSGVPGPVFETTADAAAFIKAGVFDLERVARFRDESFEVADGHASERFVDQVV